MTGATETASRFDFSSREQGGNLSSEHLCRCIMRQISLLTLAAYHGLCSGYGHMMHVVFCSSVDCTSRLLPDALYHKWHLVSGTCTSTETHVIVGDQLSYHYTISSVTII